MFSTNTTADSSHQYENHTGKLWVRDKFIAKHVSLIRRVKKTEAIDGTHGRMAAVPSEEGNLVRWKLDETGYRHDAYFDLSSLHYELHF